MKKLFALLLAAVMCFSLVACGGGNDTPNADNNNEPQTNNSETQQETMQDETTNSEQQTKENATLFVGVWTNGNTTLTVNEDGSCNQFTKEGYVKGEPQTDISTDFVWEVDDNGNLLTIDEAEGGYNVWVRTVEDGVTKITHEGSNTILTLEEN